MRYSVIHKVTSTFAPIWCYKDIIQVLSKGSDRSLSAVSIYGDVGTLPRSFLVDKTAGEFRKSIEELKKQIRKNKKVKY